MARVPGGTDGLPRQVVERGARSEHGARRIGVRSERGTSREGAQNIQLGPPTLVSLVAASAEPALFRPIAGFRALDIASAKVGEPLTTVDIPGPVVDTTPNMAARSSRSVSPRMSVLSNRPLKHCA
jgi:hypothetical protein